MRASFLETEINTKCDSNHFNSCHFDTYLILSWLCVDGSTQNDFEQKEKLDKSETKGLQSPIQKLRLKFMFQILFFQSTLI